MTAYRIYETNSRIFADPIDPKIQKSTTVHVYRCLIRLWKFTWTWNPKQPFVNGWLSMGWWFQTFTTGKWFEITISIGLKMVVIGVPGIYRGMLWLSIVFLDCFFLMVMHGQCLGLGAKIKHIPKWWFNGESPLVERIAHGKNHEYIDAKMLGGWGEKNIFPRKIPGPKSKAVGKSSQGRQLHLMATEPGGVSCTVSLGRLRGHGHTP